MYFRDYNTLYAKVEITNRSLTAPSEGNDVKYAEVKPQGKGTCIVCFLYMYIALLDC